MTNSTLYSQIKSITTGANTSGKRILWAVEASIDHMFKHNDWTPLAHIMNKLELPQDRAQVKRIVVACVGGLSAITKGKEAEAQPTGMIIKRGDNCATTDKMPILRQLVKDGESFRGKVVKEQLFDATDTEFDLHKLAANLLKRLEKNDCTLAQLLDEVGKVVKEQSVIDPAKPEHMDKKVKVAAVAA